MTRPLAALTGSTGFLGRHLVRALDRAGYRLRVLVSRADAVFEAAPSDFEMVVGRLEHSEALARLADGAEVLVHNAGLIKAVRPADFFLANAAGARRAAEALSPHGRFVLVSSISAREPQLSPYAASKAAGEAAVSKVLAPERLTIVRPCAIYGPGDAETLAFFKAVGTLPVLPLPGDAQARLTMIHGADAAAQIAAVVGQAPSGAVYTLADGRPEGYPLKEIMQTVADILGRRPGFVRAPRSLILAAGAAGGAMAQLSGKAAFFSLGKARELLHADWSVRAQDLPPGAPPAAFDLAAGFADSIAWWRARGRL